MVGQTMRQQNVRSHPMRTVDDSSTEEGMVSSAPNPKDPRNQLLKIQQVKSIKSKWSMTLTLSSASPWVGQWHFQGSVTSQLMSVLQSFSGRNNTSSWDGPLVCPSVCGWTFAITNHAAINIHVKISSPLKYRAGMGTAGSCDNPG